MIRTAVVLLFITPIAISSAMIAAMVSAEVEPGTATMSMPTEQTLVQASSLSNDNAPAKVASIIPASSETGIASVYSGEKTANGEYAHASALTAAHKSLPFGTKVKVTNVSTGQSVVVRINDRGPYIKGRIIDLTPAGARAIGSSGLTMVQLTVQ